MNNLIAFSTSQFCATTILYLVPKSFITSKGNPILIKQSLLILPYPQSLASTNLLPISMSLPILDISYKWNHTICDLCVCLLSLNIFKVHQCCITYQYITPFYG